mmetsp:Transcript_60087/g.95406  ORF Transcript_60087/g.95406 Transcript_60087/m.95406 type:complete len:87 (+) Transcript_60087:720-980(+)
MKWNRRIRHLTHTRTETVGPPRKVEQRKAGQMRLVATIGVHLQEVMAAAIGEAALACDGKLSEPSVICALRWSPGLYIRRGSRAQC